jgi:hypothetical protein
MDEFWGNWDSPLNKAIGILCIAGIAAIIIIGVLSDKNTEKQTEIYNEAFAWAVSGVTAREVEIQYTGQDKLYTYRGESWTKDFIPSRYVSKTPEDLGGILIVTTNTRHAATYVVQGTNNTAAVAVWRDFTLKLIDPYNNVTVGEKTFRGEGTPPSSVSSSTGIKYLDPPRKEMNEWVETMWEQYLRNRD